MRFPLVLLLLCTLICATAYAANNATIKTVVIDAGHGGKDPGATGPGKDNEKDIALAVALKLGEDIHKGFPDVNIIYTRTTDTFIELHARAEIANKNKADLFIAIHCNSSPLSQFFGTSTYVLGLHRTEANLEVAKRENSVILLEGDRDKHYEFDPNSPEGNIIMSMKQNAYLDQSIDIASKIESQFETNARRKSLGVKQAGFYVLYKTAMPSILSEIGFISNPDEENFLASEKGQEQIATALFKAFKEYKYEMENRSGEPVAESPSKKPAATDVAEVPPVTTDSTVHKVADPVNTINTNTTATDSNPVNTTALTVAVDTGIITTMSGKKIRRPIENSSGGGNSLAAATKPDDNNVPSTNTEPGDGSEASVPVINTIKNNPAEPAPVKENPKANTNPPAPKATDVVNSKPGDIAPHTKESGTVFKVQIMALKIPLKGSEHDRILRIFNVVSEQALPSGVTRYYAGDVRSYAAAKKIKSDAVSHGYKDAFIVGFKNGERMSINEMKAFEN